MFIKNYGFFCSSNPRRRVISTRSSGSDGVADAILLASPSGKSQCFTYLLPSCVRIHRFCSQSLPPRRLFQTQGASCCFVRSGGLRHHNRCSHAVVIAGCLRHGSPGKCIHAMFLSLVYFSALPILIQVQLHASV